MATSKKQTNETASTKVQDALARLRKLDASGGNASERQKIADILDDALNDLKATSDAPESGDHSGRSLGTTDAPATGDHSKGKDKLAGTEGAKGAQSPDNGELADQGNKDAAKSKEAANTPENTSLKEKADMSVKDAAKTEDKAPKK